MRKNLILLLLLILAWTVLLSAKDRKWQTGKLLSTDWRPEDSESGSFHGGTVAAEGGATSEVTRTGREVRVNGKPFPGPAGIEASNSAPLHLREFQRYVIRLGDTVYTAQESVRGLHPKPTPVTDGADIKIAVEKTKLYLIDDQGKEHQATILKKSVDGVSEPHVVRM